MKHIHNYNVLHTVVPQGSLPADHTWHGGKQGDLPEGGTWHGGKQGDLPEGGTWHGGR